MPPLKPLILASASPRRAELLRHAGIPFTVLISPAKEPERKPSLIPTELWPCSLAYIKAAAVQQKIKNQKSKIENGIILAADTIVLFNNRIFNKARHRSHAKAMLRTLNHQPHHVITGLCLMSARDARFRLAAATATCKLHFTPRQLETYLDSNLWKGKAGAYGIQDTPAGDPFTTLLSGHITTVIGLPMPLLQSELESFARD